VTPGEDADGPWSVIDWSAPRPDAEAVARARSTVTFAPLPEDRDAVPAFVGALGGLMRHGGALSARFRVAGGGSAARWFLSRNRFAEFGFLRLLLGSAALAEALPELGGVAFARPPDEGFRQVDPVLLDGTLAAALCWGGAYASFADRPAAAKDLGVALSDAVVGRRFRDVRLHVGEPPWWSPWFRGVAWDGTWVVTDLARREVLLLCATDTD
jgi:hypothetical protein